MRMEEAGRQVQALFRDLEGKEEASTKRRGHKSRTTQDLIEEIQGLLKSKSPEDIPHDLRNLLNEVVVLKALLEKSEERRAGRS